MAPANSVIPSSMIALILLSYLLSPRPSSTAASWRSTYSVSPIPLSVRQFPRSVVCPKYPPPGFLNTKRCDRICRTPQNSAVLLTDSMFLQLIKGRVWVKLVVEKGVEQNKNALIFSRKPYPSCCVILQLDLIDILKHQYVTRTLDASHTAGKSHRGRFVSWSS